LQKNDILPCAYSPLGGTDGKSLRENPVITKIAEAQKCGGTAILLSWLIKRGINPLPKSVTPSRIEENFKTVDLTEEQFKEIEELVKSHPSKRVCDQKTLHDPEYDIYEEGTENSDKKMWEREQAGN